MDYELAKELKDAGFPQHPHCGTCPNMEFCIPTLSELIAACGDEFYSLVKAETGEWFAYSSTDELNTVAKRGGKTPEEAVSRLWLALRGTLKTDN